MTNFTAIGYLVLTGLIIFAATMLAFGCAVRARHHAIAPRCTARPKNSIYNPNSIGQDVQNRGGPFFGWISWCMSLSFDTMLRGVPGTGTRKGGLEGALLKANLDSIILIKFHDLCLKVCALTTFLAMVFILPLNWTATCVDCRLTDYETTTLANIPPITKDNNGSDLLFRLYMIVICNWIVVIYSLHLVDIEWKENLGLRRAFYLEADHLQNRKDELDDTIGSMTSDDSDDKSVTSADGLPNETKRAFFRDPWIPHPEQRDTVPNIELYSVLVHNLPALPSEVMYNSHEHDVITFSRRQTMDWQLTVATSFFDHIVPNQPGFSSSVAAVTVLPSATELATAWRRWYTAAGKLRRLRFIRTIISKKRAFDIESQDDDNEITSEISASTRNSSAAHTSYEFALNAQSVANNETNEDYHMSEGAKFHRYCREVYGARDDPEVEDQFFKALEYGPEQTAVYARESAQGAAACCPHGCAEERLYTADFQELLDMEKEAVEEVQKANEDLLVAQKQAAMIDEQSINIENQQQEAPYGDRPIMYTGATNSGVELELPQKVSKSNLSDLENIDTLDCFPEKLQTESELYAKYTKSPLISGNSLSRSSNSLENLPPKNITTGRMQPGIPKHPPAPTNRNLNMRLNENLPKKGSTVMNDIMHTAKGTQGSFDHHAPTPPIKNLNLFSIYPPTTPNAQIPVHQTQNSLRSSTTTKIPLSAQRSFRQSLKRVPSVALNAGGKFEIRHFDSIGEDEDMQASVISAQTPKNRMSIHKGLRDDGSVQTRRRLNSNNSGNQGQFSDQWLKYQMIREDDLSHVTSPTKGRNDSNDDSYDKTEKPFSGVYRMVKIPRPREMIAMIAKFVRGYFNVTTAVHELARENTVCVVTFTSRQAATSARHCLADGRGASRWVADSNLPVPPLADAASFDFKTCRGCCRPVTVSINKRQKMVRKYVSMTALICLYVFYIVPINLATSVFNENRLTALFPSLKEFEENFLFNNSISGIVQALLLTLFFSLAPQLFKMIANFGSNAHSVITAERDAMKYYWWFMVTTAFAGNGIVTAVLDTFNEALFDDSFKKLLTTIADSVPTKVSATWINWMILRTTVVLPLQYLLQVNTFMFYFFGWKCCARCVMGGGPGGQTPYRIYIDSGVVFMCNVALSFAAPLTAPCALIYFCLCLPLWRRNSIFMYRPKYDGGGIRWPFLADEIFSSLLVGQVLLITMMSLREAIGPAVMAGVPMIPTIMCRKVFRTRYLKAYLDAGLLQTSLLDEWDNSKPSSVEKREEFRRFLVDAHKAAYIPVCIASSATSSLTSQPAVVIHKEGDIEPPHGFDANGSVLLDNSTVGGVPIGPIGGIDAGGSHNASMNMSINMNMSMSETQQFTPFLNRQQVGVSMRRVGGHFGGMLDDVETL